MPTPATHRRITVELSLGHIALLRRLSGAEGEASFGWVIEILLDADDRRARAADGKAAEIADLVGPLSEEPCATAVIGPDGLAESDCGECTSCIARAVESMIVDLRRVLVAGKGPAATG